jgi:hypothetical protein
MTAKTPKIVEDDKGRRYAIVGTTDIFGIPAYRLCRVMKKTGSQSVWGKKQEAVSTVEKFYTVIE